MTHKKEVPIMEIAQVIHGIVAVVVAAVVMSGAYEVKKALRCAGGCRVR